MNVHRVMPLVVGPSVDGFRCGSGPTKSVNLAATLASFDEGLTQMTASIRSIEQRLRAVEARLADIEGGYGDILYSLRREAIGTRITLNRMAARAGIEVATDDEIDAALDQDS